MVIRGSRPEPPPPVRCRHAHRPSHRHYPRSRRRLALDRRLDTRLTGGRVLVLDADGVLLRLPQAQRLESVELLEDFLREPEFSDLLVMASGDWRRYLGLEGVRRIFSADLRERIGVVPEIAGTDGFRAHVEINVWVSYHRVDNYVVLEGGHCWMHLPALECAVFTAPGGVLTREDLDRVTDAFRLSRDERCLATRV